MRLGGREGEWMGKAGPYPRGIDKAPRKWAGEDQALLNDCPLLVSFPTPPPNAGSPLYSNVLYRPRRAPRKSEAWPVERKVLDSEDQKGQSFYSISFPQRPTPKSHLAPKSCPSPRPIHPISAVRISPGPGSSGQPRSRGFLEVGREIRTQESQRRPPPSDYIKM